MPRFGDIRERWRRRSPLILRVMTEKRIWFVTGAGRGMGVDIAEAALAGGHAVVATGRNTGAVADAVGEADELLVSSSSAFDCSSGGNRGRWNPAHAPYGRAPFRGHSRTLAHTTLLVRGTPYKMDIRV